MMDSPFSRMIAAVLGGYVFLLLLLFGYEWITTEYPRPSTEARNTARIQHAYAHHVAVNALQRFSQLPRLDQAVIRENLNANMVAMDQWVKDLNHSAYQILCLGEFHRESTRRFLADTFFAHVQSDVLLLEATPHELRRLTAKVEAGRAYFPLLEADIMEILRAVQRRNPAIEIHGIEETDTQRKPRGDQTGARDRSMTHNVWERFHPGKRHIILVGASHCAHQSNWLFGNLNSQAPLPLRDQMGNVQVLGEHQAGPVEAFVFFLDEIGLDRTTFVIPDTHGLHPLIYEWFRSFTRQTLESFSTLVVFRTEAPVTNPAPP